MVLRVASVSDARLVSDGYLRLNFPVHVDPLLLVGLVLCGVA